MSQTAIAWTNETWNPVTGCSHVSEGCRHCYAETLSLRMGWSKRPWTARNAMVNVRLRPDRLDQPLRWRRPRMVFVNSMSDLFHEEVPDSYIAHVFAVMAAAYQHTFQVLTKRPERMRDLLSAVAFWQMASNKFGGDLLVSAPLSNVWLGVSVEDQANADERIPLLLQTPATLRFLSCEPLLGPIRLRQDWRDFLQGWDVEPIHVCGGDEEACAQRCPEAQQYRTERIAWVIVGGESGPSFRPMDAAWARDLRDQCVGAGVPFFMKQDSGPRPGEQGRIPDELWVQEFPGPREAVTA